MRWRPIICLTCLSISASWAQQQETSLVDRLLRPNLELQNKAQGKKFVASSALVEHRGSVGTFLLQPNRVEKSFIDTRALAATEYPSRSARAGGKVAPIQTRSANAAGSVKTSSVHDIHGATELPSVSADRSFSNQQQFREQGKSQKSLDRHNPPLTIEQVRELLNKNK